MAKSQWSIKTFHKKEAVKIIYVGADKRITSLLVLPEQNTVTYKDKSYVLIPEKIFTHEGYPTLIINYKDAEPLDPLELDNYIYAADDFNTAISSKVGKELFEATKEKGLGDLSTILSGLSLLGVLYLAYTFSGQITEIIEKLDTLNTFITGGQ